MIEKELEKRYFVGDKIGGSQQAIEELQAFILEQRMRLPAKLTPEDLLKVKDIERLMNEEMNEAKRKEELQSYYLKYEKIIEKYKKKR